MKYIKSTVKTTEYTKDWYEHVARIDLDNIPCTLLEWCMALFLPV